MKKGMWDFKKLMCALQGGFCFFCGRTMSLDPADKIEPHYATRDHMLPKSLGGDDSWGNTVMACRACNQNKGGRVPTEMECIRQAGLFAVFEQQVAKRAAEMEAETALAGQVEPVERAALFEGVETVGPFAEPKYPVQPEPARQTAPGEQVEPTTQTATTEQAVP